MSTAYSSYMARRQEDLGVEPEGEEIVLTGHGPERRKLGHVQDGTGRPAAPEDDMAGD